MVTENREQKSRCLIDQRLVNFKVANSFDYPIVTMITILMCVLH